jgi:hypothetical protein
MSTFPLTVIIPVHALDAQTTPLLKEALSSVANQKEAQVELTVVVIPGEQPELEAAVQALVAEQPTSTKFVVALNDEAPIRADIASQLNATLPHVTSEYVTILELDDQLDERYVFEMAKHTQAMPEVDGWLPLAVCVDEDLRLLKYGNEAIWVPKTEEVRPDGTVDAETTEVAPDMLLSGAMLKTSVYADGYGLKGSITLTFINEFFRRIVARGAVLRGMGKVLYLHRERRPGSYLYELMVGEAALTQQDSAYWLDVARKESAFEVERPLAR